MMSSTAQVFSAAVLGEFPHLREALEEAGGSLDGSVGAFAQYTQGAKEQGDWPTYERCIALADRQFAAASGELALSFRAAFFERLNFEGSRGPAAWQLLTPALQAAWKQMDAENRRLMALPQNRRKDNAGMMRGPWGGAPMPPRGGGGGGGRRGPKGPPGPRGPKGRGGRGGRGGGRGGR